MAPWASWTAARTIFGMENIHEAPFGSEFEEHLLNIRSFGLNDLLFVLESWVEHLAVLSKIIVVMYIGGDSTKEVEMSRFIRAR